MDSHVYKLKLCPLGGLSSTTVFQTITKHGCHSAATFRLYLHTEPTHLWSKLKRFSPPSAAHTRVPTEPQVWAEGHGCNSLDLGEKREIWATCSSTLLVPFAPLCSLFQMWQVHLMFLLGLFNLVLHGSVRTLLVVRISHTATSQSFHTYQCSVQFRLFLKKNNSLLQTPWPCCRTWGCCSSTGSSSNTLRCFFPPVIPPKPQGLLDNHRRTLSCSGNQSILQCEIFAPKSNIPKRNISKKTD